ncbi:MAG: PAS domain S-box protein [Pseudomonadota bacterium]
MEHHLRRIQGNEDPELYHFRIIDRGGQTRWISNNGVIVSWGGGPATLNFMSDITDQKHMEEALRVREEQFRKIFSESPIGIEVYDSEGQLLNINRSCLEILGISNTSQIRGLNLFKDPNMPDDLKEKLVNGESLRCEISFDFEKVKELLLYETTKTGKIYLDVLITPLGGDAKESVGGYLVQVQEITNRKKADEQIHILTHDLMKAQENERQLISRELHDRVGQDLSILKIGLDTLFDHQPDFPSHMRKKLSELSKTLQGTILAVRDLAYDLRPPSLDQLGLVQTLFQYCEDFCRKNKLHLDFRSAGMDYLRFDPDTEINLYRLIQEGLNNIRKHAEAVHVTVRLVASYPHIILRLEDDGIGFDVDRRSTLITEEKRMGLRSMEERVHLLGGKMNIGSRPAQGTKILIEVPYKEKRGDVQKRHPDC